MSEPTSDLPRMNPLTLFLLGFAGLFLGACLMLAYCFADESAEITQLLNEGTIKPRPEWTPEKVVAIQMAALKSSLTDPLGVADCFALASPSNRIVTGPIERFAVMLSSPSYRPLVDRKSCQIGKAVVNGGYAVVLVTVVQNDGRLLAYRFLLSRQDQPEVAGCWMTNAVLIAAPPVVEQRR